VEQDPNSNIFCTIAGKCTLIFEASLKAGENIVTLNLIDSASTPIVVKEIDAGLSYKGSKFAIELNSNQVRYNFQGQ
jgi:hypothetical protein